MTTAGEHTFSPAENDLLLLLPANCPASVDLTEDGTPPTTKELVAVSSDDLQLRCRRHHDHQRVVINVSGLCFETERRTLQRYPLTLLGSESRLAPFYRPHLDVYFFDRHRSSFESVLHYYQSGGELRRPCNVPARTFVDEVVFFDLGDEAIDRLKEDEGLASDDDDDDEENEERLRGDDKKRARKEARQRQPSGRVRRFLWDLFEHPDKSVAAKAMAVFSLAMVMLSVVTFCVETLPVFRNKGHLLQAARNLSGEPGDSSPGPASNVPWSDPLFQVETVCIVWFSVELTLRLFACPDKLAFIRDFTNIIDFVSSLPYAITLAMDLLGSSHGEKSKAVNFAVLRTVRLLRVCRILKLSRYSQGLQVLAKTMRASFQEILNLLIFVAVAVVLYASAIYFAEVGDDDANFSSVPDAFWWAVVTLTTVGYGDMTPVTVPGKLVGAMCALSGVLLIALPVPVVVNNFSAIYALQKRKMSKLKLKRTKARRVAAAAEELFDGSPESSRRKCSPCSPLCCLHRGPWRRDNLEQKTGPQVHRENELRQPRETKV